MVCHRGVVFAWIGWWVRVCRGVEGLAGPCSYRMAMPIQRLSLAMNRWSGPQGADQADFECEANFLGRLATFAQKGTFVLKGSHK